MATMVNEELLKFLCAREGSCNISTTNYLENLGIEDIDSLAFTYDVKTKAVDYAYFNPPDEILRFMGSSLAYGKAMQVATYQNFQEQGFKLNPPDATHVKGEDFNHQYYFEYGVDFVYVKDLWFKPPVE